MSTTTVLPPEPVAPDVIHSCPSCSHWLPDGMLACPDCQTLTYGAHLSRLAAEAQQFEAQQKWAEARDRWNTALRWLPADTRQAASIRQQIAAIDARLKAVDDRKARWTKRLGPFAPVAFFLLKLKAYFFLLFKLKFLFSILLYFGLYWALFGWWFALGLTASIFIHEMGHYIAIRRRGLEVELPVFLPGFGAYVRWFGMGVSRQDLAAISLAGPLFGLFAAAASWGLFYWTHAGLFLVLANLTSWYNIVNMFPVFGLDGAKAVLALSRLQRGLIAVMCLVFFAITSSSNPADMGNVNNHYIFVVLALLMAWKCFTNDVPEEPHSETLVYFLGVFLVLGLVLHMTGVAASQLPQLSDQFRIH